MKNPIGDHTAFLDYEDQFCDECGEHLMKHIDGKCPPTRNDFMLEVKELKERQRAVLGKEMPHD